MPKFVPWKPYDFRVKSKINIIFSAVLCCNFDVLIEKMSFITFGEKFHISKLMKGKALRKHSLHEKTAASVLLKLFISSNE